MKIFLIFYKALLLCVICVSSVLAQSTKVESDKKTQDEIAKELANPVAPVISVPFQ
jgi:Na+-transporting methylmalonyl-CoA/oxaloacetate decarboxylase gamma subunit